MNRNPKMYCLGVLALALMMFLTLPVLAQDIRGTLININGDDKEFVMLDENLNELTFRLADGGKVFINDKEAELTDLQAGDEVAIEFEVQKDQMVANSVRCTRGP